MEKTKKRNIGLDLLKFACTFMVVMGHTSLSDVGGPMFPVARVSVVVFFMITGYFYSSTVKYGKQKQQIKKMLVILVFALALYSLWYIVMGFVSSGQRWDAAAFLRHGAGWILNTYGLAKGWYELLVFNVTPVGIHLWYLSVILYVLILAALLDKVVDRKKLYFLIPVLLLVNIALGDWSVVTVGRPINAMYTRNFLFLGLPCFLLGDFLRQYKDRIKISTAALVLISLGCIAFIWGEALFLRRFPGYDVRGVYLGTPVLATALFLLALRDLKIYENPVCGFLAEWGQRYSLGIYICHLIAIQLMPMIFGGLLAAIPLFAKVYRFVAPVLALCVATVLTMAWKALLSLPKKLKWKKPEKVS